ncbi:hypothetical protein [Nocardia ignorata]|uniref:Uncharacterized protein n=1 Tax=Nocardia ignorata TaxID=145285 RepID=A0A4R6NZU8_NOCIG|nr:hypothetical protein [Nocardia ignorata]TDP30878.1 hypothetical protein DFR75_11085 [Nocardia ignorata]
MSSDRQSDRNHDGFAEFAEELRLLAEVLLARVEPVLRRTAADGAADLGGCAWCPVCAAAALVRGDHHDVVAALAEHGTSMVTVLREALAGVPVEPVLPPEWADHAAGHPGHATDEAPGAHPTSGAGATHGDQRNSHAPSGPRGDRPASPRPDGSATPKDSSRATGFGEQPTPRPRRVDEFSARTPHITPEPADETASGAGQFTAGAGTRPAHGEERPAGARAPRSRYVDIPVTIRG